MPHPQQMTIHYIFIWLYLYQPTVIITHILLIQHRTLLPHPPPTPTQIFLLQIHRYIIQRSTTPLGLIRHLFRVIGLQHGVIGRML